MQCKDSQWTPLSRYNTDSYSVYDCDDIARKLKDAYSEYADYWDFENTWTWTGAVNGKTYAWGYLQDHAPPYRNSYMP